MADDVGSDHLAIVVDCWIDRDAGGFGWASGIDGDGVDLLSAVAHEFGHILGFDHDVLGETLGVDHRQLPTMPVMGDSNRDGVFDHRDLLSVAQRGKYLMDQPATWSEGDWNGDGRFDEDDIIKAFQAGNYAVDETFSQLTS